MDVDIDSFIREQKSKIATERQYLSNQNLSVKTPDYNAYEKSNKKNSENFDNFVFKMKEGENMKNKYKQELRNDYANVKEFNKHLELSSRKEKETDKPNTNGLLPGLGYSNSATKKKELIRNHEYNEFKKIEAENFKNRFQNKKVLSNREGNNSHLTRNPITSDFNAKENLISTSGRQTQKIHSFSPTINDSSQDRNRSFESKVDILEKKVDELRKFRIQNNDFDYENPKEQQFNFGYEPSFVPIKSSKSLRSLEETDKKLREIDEKYELSKANFMNTRRIGKKKINFILDDETILDNQSFQRPLSDIGTHERPITNSEPSIIPIGRNDEETRRRLKQEQYRKDLENQMKEKSKSQKRIANSISNENISFFDRFGQPANKPITNKVASARADISVPHQDSDYFYYASRNPLEEFDSNPYVPSSFNINDQRNINEPNINQPKTSIRISHEPDTNKNLKVNYAEELKKQIEERKVRKEIDKKSQEEYERRKNEEIRNYDPFGRGGGGAPLKDNRGEVIADLKNIKFDSKIVIPPLSFRPQVEYYKEPEKSIISPDPNELKTYARGGHGIFGQALSDDDKIKAEKYKEDLKVQIELNKRHKEIEKENERKREEKEREKFEKEQKLIQLELENEKKLQRQKELEHIQKLEEHRLAAQENRKTKERLEYKAEEPKSSSPNQFRIRENSIAKSPIVARNRTPLENKPKTPTEIKINQTPFAKNHDNKEMTNNFYSLKAKLGHEMALLEKEIAHQNDGVEIYDPRLEASRHLDKQIHSIGYESDMVFDAVLQKKGPLSVRRGYFKPKRNRQNSAITTEMDLDEHLKQQEKVLQRMHQNNFSRYELNMPDMNPVDLSIRPTSQMSNQLESDTKFIDFQQSRDFNVKSSLSSISNKEYDFFKPLSPKPLRTNPEFGSNTSLNIDEITRKNQQRLRKLQKIQIENEKSQTTEEILNKFMSSQDL